MRRLDIGIVGAGIGGLAAAALLADLGHSVAIFDRFVRPAPVGSGLVIQPTGRAVLIAIGADQRAASLGNRIARMHGTDAGNGRTVLDVSYRGPASRNYGMAIHRASLFASLFEAVQRRPVEVRSGETIVGRDGGRLHMASGSVSRAFDLIVDASGAQSALSPLAARPLPYGALWGVVDWVDSPGISADELTQRYRGSRRMIGILPLGRMPEGPSLKAAVFWSLAVRDHAAWVEHGLDAWKREAAEIWPEAMPFLDQIADPGALTMARYSHGTLRRPIGDRIVFLGDAAHRASPQLGQGANMAMLDALALSRSLAAFPDASQALEAYVAARRWHIRTYQAISAVFTPQYQSDSTCLPILRDRVLYPLSRVPPAPRLLERLVSGDLVAPIRGLPVGKWRDA